MRARPGAAVDAVVAVAAERAVDAVVALDHVGVGLAVQRVVVVVAEDVVVARVAVGAVGTRAALDAVVVVAAGQHVVAELTADAGRRRPGVDTRSGAATGGDVSTPAPPRIRSRPSPLSGWCSGTGSASTRAGSARLGGVAAASACVSPKTSPAVAADDVVVAETADEYLAATASPGGQGRCSHEPVAPKATPSMTSPRGARPPQPRADLLVPR